MKTADNFFAGRTPNLSDLDIELADRSLRHFMRVCWHVLNPFEPFEETWHIGCLCEHLEAVTKGQILKLIINLPPRHLKSWIASVMWFSWVWQRDPASKWIFGNYDKGLVERDSVRCRDLVTSNFYRENFKIKWNIKSDMDKKDEWANTMGGLRISTTPDGVGTGLDAKYLVVDDLHNVRDSRRPQKMADDYDWLTRQMSTRGINLAEYRRVLIGQRIGSGDVYGRLMAEKMGYETLVLPLHYDPSRLYFTPQLAEASGDENAVVLTSLQIKSESARDQRKVAGEVIHPKRFPPQVVKELESALRDDAPAQLEQKSVSLKGRAFDKGNLRYFAVKMSRRWNQRVIVLYRDLVDKTKIEIIPISKCRFFQVADTAMTAKKTSSLTAVGTFGLTPLSDLLVFSMFTAHLEVAYQFGTIKALKDGPVSWNEETRETVSQGTWPFVPLFQAVEAKASGHGLIDLGKISGHNLVPLPNSSVDKLERSGTVATMVINNKVFVNHDGGDWRTKFENQLIEFPKSPWDDMVDTLSYAGILAVKDQLLAAFLNFDGGMMATAAEASRDYRSIQSTEPEFVLEDAAKQESTYAFQAAGGKIDVFFPDD